MNYDYLKTSAKTSAKLECHRLSLVSLYARKTFTMSSQNYPVHSDHRVREGGGRISGGGKKGWRVSSAEGGCEKQMKNLASHYIFCKNSFPTAFTVSPIHVGHFSIVCIRFPLLFVLTKSDHTEVGFQWATTSG